MYMYVLFRLSSFPLSLISSFLHPYMVYMYMYIYLHVLHVHVHVYSSTCTYTCITCTLYISTMVHLSIHSSVHPSIHLSIQWSLHRIIIVHWSIHPSSNHPVILSPLQTYTSYPHVHLQCTYVCIISSLVHPSFIYMYIHVHPSIHPSTCHQWLICPIIHNFIESWCKHCR